MIIVAFIFSITASLGKMAIEHSSPLFFASFYFILITILFTPIAFRKNRGRIRFEKKDVVILSSIGITYSMMVYFHMIAIDLVNVAYMISIKRTSLLFSILYGYFLFREERITEKAIGVTIMLIGLVLIVLSK
jgi:drug/metabolite transporter (DMT)-like permease